MEVNESALIQLFEDGEEWIKYAIEDLNSSISLYERGDKRNALFLLQQASEKLSKALLLLLFLTYVEGSSTLPKERRLKIPSTKKLLHNPLLKTLEFAKKMYGEVDLTWLTGRLQTLGNLSESTADELKNASMDNLIVIANRITFLDTEVLNERVRNILDDRLLSVQLTNWLSLADKILGNEILKRKVISGVAAFSEREGVEAPPYSSLDLYIKYFVVSYIFLMTPSFYISSMMEFAIASRYPDSKLEKKHQWVIENFESISREVMAGLNYCASMSRNLKNDSNLIQVYKFIDKFASSSSRK